MGEPSGPALRFFWNGLKVDGGPLVLVWYSHDDGWRYQLPPEPERISVAAQAYALPDELHRHRQVINRSNYESDYVDHDRIHVHPGDPDWPAVAAAYARSLERKILRLKRRADKSPTKYNLEEVTGTERTLARFVSRHLDPDRLICPCWDGSCMACDDFGTVPVDDADDLEECADCEASTAPGTPEPHECRPAPAPIAYPEWLP